LYHDWNEKINVISRKDIDALYKAYFTFLGIAKVIDFVPGTYVLDVGTGGGFPGIPLAILFPETFLPDRYHCQKIKVVQAVVDVLELKNVKTEQLRAELVKGDFDFIVSRAVTNMPDFVSWIKDKVKRKASMNCKMVFSISKEDLTEEKIFQKPHNTIWLISSKMNFLKLRKWCMCL
jgi:16S rRNA (guanine527-N7)-methyltransferase